MVNHAILLGHCNVILLLGVARGSRLVCKLMVHLDVLETTAFFSIIKTKCLQTCSLFLLVVVSPGL